MEKLVTVIILFLVGWVSWKILKLVWWALRLAFALLIDGKKKGDNYLIERKQTDIKKQEEAIKDFLGSAD